MSELDNSVDHIRSDIGDDDDKKPTSSLIQLYEMPWREYLKHKNYDTDIGNMCKNCQREQIRKYGEITIKCSGPKDISVLDQNIVANMNSDELDEIKQAMSPVYWAEKNIDVNQQDPTKRLYVNRWYQSMQLTCLHGDSEILMSDGSKKKIKDVNVGDMVVSYNEIRRSTPANRVLNKWNNGKKEVFRITLENGDYIDATADHKILGWIRTGRENQMLKCPSFRTDYGSIASGDIKVGTDIYVLNKYKKFGSVDDDNLAKILGYLCTDGYLRINKSYNRVEFRNIRKAYVDEIFNAIVDRFGDIPLYREFEERVDKSGSVHQKHYGIFLYKRGTNITSFLKAIGAVNKNTRELNILRWASKNLSEKSFGVFLNRVISGDGNVYPVPNTNTSRIAISGKYRSKFLYELKDILRSIGVYRAAIYHRVNEDGKGSVLHIANSHSLKALLSLTGEIFGKEENTRIVLNNISNISKDRRNGRLKRGAFNTSTRVKIVSIESIGVHDVYDIEVDKRHNFIANNVIVHNCSASKKAIRCGRRSGKSYGLGIDIANRLVQNSNYQILVVTPFLSQAKELTNVVKKILRSLGDTIGTWDDLVERSVTSPYQEIQMKNGSTFKAFTAGNDNANAVRGQGAHLIIIDEADFLTQEAFDSITAILMDKPNTEIICTSTPMGEGLLYKFANSKDYKEFHFPSFCIPHYNDDMDKEFRNSLSMMAYIQEIMAEFGLSDNSVFDTDLVNRSTSIGTSESLHNVITNRNRYIVSLGCDWNADKVGTRICVIAYDKIEHKVIIANLSNVRREGWTQVAAIDKIVELNRLYTPDYIYVDEGFGEANVQQLKLIAVNLFGKVPADHPDLKLRDVVPVNFSSTLELRDVMTGEIRKKYFKNFIVETTKRALETGLLAFKDPISAPIVEQMKNYIIKSRAANGRETYEAKSQEIGDHDLDAFMIALAGLQLNENSILDTRRYSNVTILPLEKRGTEAYNNSDKIEKRSYGNDEKYHRTVRVAPGISRRSSISGGPMGNRGRLSRETASTFMNRYRTTMRSKSR
jgi:intein N-terminal splicing region|nr:MAG TPA: Terminase [Bacteriophage sp.]